MQWTDKYRNEYVFILYVCHYYLYFCILKATGSELFMDINQQNVPPTDEHLVYEIIVCTICMHTMLVAMYIIILYTSTNTTYTDRQCIFGRQSCSYRTGGTGKKGS